MTEPAPSPRVHAGGWYCLTLVGSMQLLSMLDRNILAILNPRIKADLHIGDAEMGLLYGTVFALFYAVFSLPLGRLADGWKRGQLLAWSIAGWSLATALGGFAGSFAVLALARLGVGIGEAASQPAGTSLVFDYFPRARRGLALAVMAALLSAGLGLSSVLGGAAAAWWDAHAVAGHALWGLKGWQFAFLVAAAPGLPLALVMARLPEPPRGLSDGVTSPVDPAPFAASLATLVSVLPLGVWWRFARDRVSAAQWRGNLGALAGIVVLAVSLTRLCRAISPRPPLHLGGLLVDPHALQWAIVGFGAYVTLNLVQSLRQADPPAHAVITRSPALWLCMLVGALQSGINYGIMGFTPAFLIQRFHLAPLAVGVQFGLLATALGIAGPVISGPLSDWFDTHAPGRGRVWVVLFALACSPLIALAVYSAPSAGQFYLRFTLYSLVLTMWLPPLYAVLYEQVLPRMRGRTAALYLIVMTIIGMGIGPYVVGMVADHLHGALGPAILSINLVSPVIVVLLLVLARRAERDRLAVVVHARAAGEPV